MSRVAPPSTAALLASAVLLGGVAALVGASCSYPDFQFGAGGSGGDGGSGGTTTTTTTVPPVEVPCKDPSVNCAPGQVCCFHKTNAALDTCGQSGACGADFAELSCNEPADCPNQICCISSVSDGVNTSLESIKCAPTCSGALQRAACSVPADCPSSSCVDVFATPYPGYLGCL